MTLNPQHVDKTVVSVQNDDKYLLIIKEIDELESMFINHKTMHPKILEKGIKDMNFLVALKHQSHGQWVLK